ncbi:hypothetical protein HHI36_006652 [Cryptolaemus montrouzieri]|uniref:N-acetyltransferase domain-containing protein n=1 Tax=Cryptolaemus montrouzieri TaxID=559131 RepID=A0ABD2NXQ1_9CUCU
MDIASSRKPLPSVWKTFERVINGRVRKFWIQDLPEDQIEVALDLMREYYLRDEPINKALNILEDEISTSCFRQIWRGLFLQGYSLACYTKIENGENKIVAVNCCIRKLSGEPDDREKYIKGECLNKVYELTKYVKSLRDPLEIGIHEYLTGMGLATISEFRGHKIGLEMLHARKPLCIASGLKASITAFTAHASQKLAEKAGFKDFISITFDEIEKINPSLKIPNINVYSERVRYMYILYE